MSQVSEIIFEWTPETSGRVASIQIQSRIVGFPEWTEQAATFDPSIGAFKFTSNAPATDTEVRARYRNTDGVYGAWFTGHIVTAPAVVEWATDIVGEGKPADNATVGAPPGTTVDGRPVEQITGDIDNAKGNAQVAVDALKDADGVVRSVSAVVAETKAIVDADLATIRTERAADKQQLEADLTDMAADVAAANQAGVNASAEAARVRSDLNANVMEVRGEVTAANTKLDGEVARAKAAEGAIVTTVVAAQGRADAAHTAISTETTQRTDADTALSHRIDTVESTANTDKGTLNTRITNEVAALVTADEAIGRRIDSVTTQANTDRGDYTAKISDEATARSTADNALSGRSSTLEAQFRGDVESPILRRLNANANLLRIEDWKVGTTGTQGRFYRNGDEAENSIVMRAGPLGFSEPCWKMVSQDVSEPVAGSHADGGWDCTIPASDMDVKASYRYMAWVYREAGASGSIYLGTTPGGVKNLHDNSINGNPYFWAGGLPVEKWFLIVGMLHGCDYTGGQTGISGVYDPVTAKLYSAGADYKIASDAGWLINRAYQFYSDVGSTSYFARPSVERIGPNTLSIEQLFATFGMLPSERAELTSTTSRITAEETTRANADSALASRSTKLEAQMNRTQDSELGRVINVVDARVSTEETTRANADSALASRATTLETNVSLLPENFRVKAAGNGVPGALRDAGIFVANGGWATGAGRSYIVAYFAATTNGIDGAEVFDVYGAGVSASGRGANQMAAYLNAIPEGRTVIVYSYDEPLENRLTAGMVEAMERVGAGEAFFSPNFHRHAAYILVGRAGVGRGNGTEYYAGAYDSDPNAYLDIIVPMRGGRANMGSGGGAVAVAARLKTEETTRANADSALTTRITNAESEYRGNNTTTNARIGVEETTRADAISALANRTSVVEARSGAGGNLIPQTSLNDLTGWTYGGHRVEAHDVGINVAGGSDWWPQNERVFSMREVGDKNPDGYWDFASIQFAVQAGVPYQFYAWVAAHRAKAEVYIIWFNANGGIISYSSSGQISVNEGGRDLSGWSRIGVPSVLSPAGASTASLVIRKATTLPGYADSYMWAFRPYFSEARVGQTEFNAFTHGSGSPYAKAVDARVTDEATARANADGALATRAQALEAQFRGDIDSPVFARLRTEETTRANADSALANRSTTLESQLSGTAASGLKTLLDNKRSNLALVDWWKKGASIPWGFNGGQRNEIVEFPHGGNFEAMPMPDGSSGDAWLCQADSGQPAGGWNGGQMAPLDPDKTYRFVIPIATLGSGLPDGVTRTSYWGTGGVCELNTGSENTNPYFAIASNLPTNKWHLFVGFLFPRNSIGKTHAGAGVWDMTTGAQVIGGVNYCFHPDGRQPTHRAYQFYATNGAYQAFGRPVVECVDGSESSLTWLSNADATTKAVARIGVEETTRANADSALTTRIANAESEYRTNNSNTNSRIGTEETTRANADSALASRATTLETSFRGNTGMILNGNFETGISGWDVAGNVAWVENPGDMGGTMRGIGDSQAYYQNLIPVIPSRTYRMDVRFAARGYNIINYCGLRCFDNNKNYLGNLYMPEVAGQTWGWDMYERSTTLTGVWNPPTPFYSGSYALPSACRYVQPLFLMNYVGQGTTNGRGPVVVDIDYIRLVDTTENQATNARITEEASTRADAVSALASRATTLEARGAVSGGNLVPNSGFVPKTDNQDVPGWTDYGAAGTWKKAEINWPNADYYTPTENVLCFLEYGPRSGYIKDVFSDFIQVQAGQYLQYYVYENSHRTYAGVFLYYYDWNGNLLGNSPVIDGPERGNSGRALGDYYQFGNKSWQVPGGCTQVRMVLRHNGSNPGQSDGYAWFLRPYVGMARQGQTEWNAYTVGSPRASLYAVGARITDEATVRANADSALSARSSALEARAGNVEARVSTNEGAIATVAGKTEAYFEKKASVPGADAFISAVAKNDNGVATSNVAIGGTSIALYNTENNTAKRAMFLGGGQAVFDGSITANGGILVGTGKLKVQVQAQDYAVSHDQYVSFGYDLGRAPTVTFGPCPVALNSGEVYAPYAAELSASGFRAKLLINAAPQSAAQSTGAFGNQGGNVWQTSRGGRPLSANGSYTVTVNLSAVAASYRDSEDYR